MRSFFSLLTTLFVLSSLGSTIHVKGRITNGDALKFQGIGALAIRSLDWLQPNTAPEADGSFAGTVECKPVRTAHGRWVDIEVFAIADHAHPQRSMFIRVPFAREVDLGAFAWYPSHFRLRTEGLVFDTAVPRDTLIGEPFGNYLMVRPINPAPGERVELIFGFISSGEPLETDHTLAWDDRGVGQVEFTFGQRTDTAVYTESWNETASPFDPGVLRAGCYRLHQVPTQQEHVRDLDFLLGRTLDIIVAERTGP